jgi:hypothetical protein
LSKDNNIKIFTAADIEKYHKGLLSSKESQTWKKLRWMIPSWLMHWKVMLLQVLIMLLTWMTWKKDWLKKWNRKSDPDESGWKNFFPLDACGCIGDCNCRGRAFGKTIPFYKFFKNNIAKVETIKSEAPKADDTANGIVTFSGTIL